jgi:hypothetical protein
MSEEEKWIKDFEKAYEEDRGFWEDIPSKKDSAKHFYLQACRDRQEENNEEIDRLKRAYRKMTEAASQYHSAHFDPTGQSGLGCPQCIRATKLRGEAQRILEGEEGQNE